MLQKCLDSSKYDHIVDRCLRRWSNESLSKTMKFIKSVASFHSIHILICLTNFENLEIAESWKVGKLSNLKSMKFKHLEYLTTEMLKHLIFSTLNKFEKFEQIWEVCTFLEFQVLFFNWILVFVLFLFFVEYCEDFHACEYGSEKQQANMLLVCF